MYPRTTVYYYFVRYAVLLNAVSCTGTVRAAAQRNPPNIVYVLADDLVSAA